MLIEKFQISFESSFLGLRKFRENKIRENGNGQEGFNKNFDFITVFCLYFKEDCVTDFSSFPTVIETPLPTLSLEQQKQQEEIFKDLKANEDMVIYPNGSVYNKNTGFWLIGGP